MRLVQNRLVRTVAAMAAAAALLQGQVAQAAAAKDCVAEADVAALAAYSMPALLGGVMKTCQPELKRDGYFATEGKQLVDRYSAGKDAAWPGAKVAFLKLGANKDPEAAAVFTALPDEALKPFVDAMLVEMVGSKIKADQCAPIERAAWLLSPLPPENTAELVGFMFSLVGDKPTRTNRAPIKICKADNG